MSEEYQDMKAVRAVMIAGLRLGLMERTGEIVNGQSRVRVIPGASLDTPELDELAAELEKTMSLEELDCELNPHRHGTFRPFQ